MKTKKRKNNLILLKSRRIVSGALVLLFAFSLFIGGGISKSVAAASDDDYNFTNLIVFVRFKGESEFVFDKPSGDVAVKKIVDNCYDECEYSVSDYYFSASNGKVRMNNLYLFSGEASVELEKERGYYSAKDESNPIGYTAGEYYTRLYELKTDWAKAITNAFNGGAKITNYEQSKTFSAKDLDENNDGVLDSLTVIYKYSNAYSVSWRDCLWNYQDYYGGATFSDASATVTSGAYLQMTANFNYLYSDANGCKFPSLKTMIHETGHIFGLKDLYRSATDSRVYYMSAMANAISPVPQYISAKEREALGWLNGGNLVEVKSEGIYTLNATSSTPQKDVICYKIPLASKEKTLYLEYRDFDSEINAYDRQAKEVFNADGKKISPLKLKSGLVCFLSDKNTRFPNNMNTTGNNWNYEVLGGAYATKSDAALAEGESLLVSVGLNVEVLSVEDGKLTFRLSGTDIEKHVHSAKKTEYKAATCKEKGNIEFWSCTICGKYFSDAAFENEISSSDVVIDFSPCVGERVAGYAPTCSDFGLTDGEQCRFCKKTLVERKKINKLPHEEGKWVTVREPTKDEDGVKEKKCLNCQTVLETEKLAYVDESGDSGDSQSPPEGGTDETPPLPPAEGEGETPPIPPSSGNDSSSGSVGDASNSSSSGAEKEDGLYLTGCVGGVSYRGGALLLFVAVAVAIARLAKKEKS